MKVTFFKIIVGLILSFVLFILIYIFYPKPSFLWNIWHKKDNNYLTQLSRDLGLSNKISQSIQCDGILNSTCSLEYIFTTNSNLSELKSKVNNLNYQERLSRTIDGFSVITTLSLHTGYYLEVNNKNNLNITNMHKNMKEPNSWGWWLVNGKDRSVLINFFELNKNDYYKLNGEELIGNIVSVSYIIKGDSTSIVK